MKVKRVYLFILAIFNIGCVTNKKQMALYPDKPSKFINYDLDSWKKKNEQSSKISNRALAEWEIGKGILISFPFDVPYNLIKEISQKKIVYVQVFNANEKNIAVETINKNDWNLKNFEFINVKEKILNAQNIGIFGVSNSDGISYIKSKFNIINSKKSYSKKDYFKINSSVRNELVDVVIDAQSIQLDGNGAMYTDLQLFDFNKRRKGLEKLRKTIVYNFGLKELIYIPFAMDSLKLSNVIRAIGKNILLIKEPSIKNSNYLQLDIISKSLHKFYSLDGPNLKIVRFKEYMINDTETCYTDSFIFNDTVFVPLYDNELDNIAINMWKGILPQHSIIGCKLDKTQRFWTKGDCLYNRIKIIF